MAYFKEFLARIQKVDKKGFDELWEEYKAGDEIDQAEYLQILLAIKNSLLAKSFSIEEALQLMGQEIYEPIFAVIMDIQTSNTPALADMAYNYLQKNYGNLPHFQDRIRLVGLKTRTNFQGAITNFLLLNHLQKGKFVFHTGGWGVGEVINVSAIREQVEIEFEKVSGTRELSFVNACKVLIPLADDHFLAKRFGDPDKFERESKKDPVETMRLLLRDLGPKTAAEIKNELAEYVIPADEWNKWWQGAKTRLKKENSIESPESAKEPFRLATSLRSIEEKTLEALGKTRGAKAFIEALYAALRDHAEITADEEVRKTLLGKIAETTTPSTAAEELSLLFLREDLHDKAARGQIEEFLASLENPVKLIEELTILAHKKRAAVEIKKIRSDWEQIFLSLLVSSAPSTLREYILKENLSNVQEAIANYLETPLTQPEFLIWYLPRAVTEKQLPFHDKAGQCQLLETYLLLLSQVEQKVSYKDLVKKMQNLLFAERFALVRAILEGSSKEFVKEFLLLVSKCHSIADIDSQTLYSLAYVVHPDLNKKSREVEEIEEELIWATQEGLNKLQDRLRQIATVETVENAREIEEARALGDLRENAEFKFALERRTRLQAELKTLSDQLQKVRVITKADIVHGEVGVGSVVTIASEDGEKSTFTLLGPYDADTEKGILAFQSKLAQSMNGLKIGEKFSFQNRHYRIVGINSYL